MGRPSKFTVVWVVVTVLAEVALTIMANLYTAELWRPLGIIVSVLAVVIVGIRLIGEQSRQTNDAAAQDELVDKIRAGSDTDQLETRLPQLPPVLSDVIRTASRDHRVLTWNLVTAATSETPPIEVFQGWERESPAWLTSAPWQVQRSAADLANTYKAPLLAAVLFSACAEQGAPRAAFWRARAALLFDEVGDVARRDAAVAGIDPQDPASAGYPRAVRAMLLGEFVTANREVDLWQPVGQYEHTLHTGLRARLTAHPNGLVEYTRDDLDRCLQVLAKAQPMYRSVGVTMLRVELLVDRVHRGFSRRRVTDLQEALELAVWARDEMRRFRGDSAAATAHACAAAIELGDDAKVLELGVAGDGKATSAEAAHPSVRAHVAVAHLNLGHLDEAAALIALVGEPAVRLQLEAHLADKRGDTDVVRRWQRALTAAGDSDDTRVPILVHLARLGVVDAEAVSDLATRSPDLAAVIEATADHAAGRTADAIRRLDVFRHQSVIAAVNLGELYGEVGDIDGQITTLRDAAARFTEPGLLAEAARLLAKAGRLSDAAAELRALLATVDDRWPGFTGAQMLAAKIAVDLHDLVEATALYTAILRRSPQHLGARWSLIRLHHSRGDVEDAWQRVLDAPEPLTPATVSDARLWIDLTARFTTPAQVIAGCEAMLRTYHDDEEFCAAITALLFMATRRTANLKADEAEVLRGSLAHVTTEWPDSLHLRVVTGDLNPETLLDQIAAINPQPPGHAEDRRRLRHRVRVRGAPFFVGATFADNNYARSLLTRVTGPLTTRLGDRTELAASAAGLQSALGQEVVVDTSALEVLRALPDDLQPKALALFAGVVTTDAVYVDIRAAVDFAVRLADDDEANLSIAAARALQDLAAGLTRVPAPRPDEPAARIGTAWWAWDSVIALARRTNTTVWSDDPHQRVLARAHHLTALSTPAIIDHLADTDAISAVEREEAIRGLIAARIGDFPIDTGRLLELAEADRWAPEAIAAVLARPTTWADKMRALDLSTRLWKQVAAHNPDSGPAWLYAATCGALDSLPAAAADARSETTSVLLATAILHLQAEGSLTAHLVTTARTALADTDHPDEQPTPDPLPATAVILRDICASEVEHGTASRAVMRTFAALEDADRAIIAGALLR